MSDKISVLLLVVGDAPILKTKKFNVGKTQTMAWFSTVIRKMISLPDDQTLFFYISQNFAPSPDHTFETLFNCFGVDGTETNIVLHYSIGPAFG